MSETELKFTYPQRKQSTGLLIVIGLFAIAVMAFVHFVSRDMIEKQKATTNWPAVQGELIDSSIDSHSARGGGQRTYYPRVTYEFSVNGIAYKGHVIAFFSHSFQTHDEAQRYLSNLAKQRKVTVYYDPADPRQCLLVPGGVSAEEGRAMRWLSTVQWILGCGILAWGVIRLAHRTFS